MKKHVTFTPSIGDDVHSTNVSSVAESEFSVKECAEVPEIFKKLADDAFQILPLPDIDPTVTSTPAVVNNLIEAVESLDSRMPLAFQEQQQILKMQGEMLQLGVSCKEHYKKIHEQSVMRYNLEKSVNKNIDDLKEGAVVAQKLVKAKSAYEEMVAKAEALMAKANK
ncbi:hypothetical protein niasHT_030826 [Heterodera trifolii]|uniref:Uncharacterized protein n=1 Tax=Heterodera trifolii TaxID=157864 RepID=A0ABD2HUY2_9BILA